MGISEKYLGERQYRDALLMKDPALSEVCQKPIYVFQGEPGIESLTKFSSSESDSLDDSKKTPKTQQQ